MINSGTGPGCLTAPSPGLGRASARGAASADAAVGGMKNPAMQHCFLMSHLSLSLLDSLPCRERDGSCPKSPSEQLLLEQSEEIRPRHTPAARDPGTAASAGTPRRNAAAAAGGTGPPPRTARAAQHRPDGQTPGSPEPTSPGPGPHSCAREPGHPRAAGAKPAEQGAWRSTFAKPRPGSRRKSHLFKSPVRARNGRGQWPEPTEKLAEKQRSGRSSIPGRARAEAGRAGVRCPKAQAPPAPSAPQGCSSCPREPAQHTGSHQLEPGPHGQSSRSAASRVGRPPWKDPQAKQRPRDPSPHQLAQGSWALRRTDEHPSPVMPTDSFPPTDTLNICPCCPGLAAASTLPRCPSSAWWKGGTRR